MKTPINLSKKELSAILILSIFTICFFTVSIYASTHEDFNGVYSENWTIVYSSQTTSAFDGNTLKLYGSSTTGKSVSLYLNNSYSITSPHNATIDTRAKRNQGSYCGYYLAMLNTSSSNADLFASNTNYIGFKSLASWDSPTVQFGYKNATAWTSLYSMSITNNVFCNISIILNYQTDGTYLYAYADNVSVYNSSLLPVIYSTAYLGIEGMVANTEIVWFDYVYYNYDEPAIINYTLTVNEPTNGAINTTSGSYEEGTTVFIEATPDPHYYLEYMNIDGVNQSWMDPTIEVLMDGDHEVSAYFDIILRGFAVYDPVGGSINATNGTYADGTTIYVEATPSANYTFSHWFTDYYLNSTDNPYELLIESNIDLYAYFDPYPVLENTLELTPNNTTLYNNETLEFNIQLLMTNGTPIYNQLIRVLLNSTVIFYNQTDVSGWVNGSYNITALEGNYTLSAQVDEYLNDEDHYIILGNSTDPQLLTISDPPAAPAPPPAHYTSDSSTPGGVLVFSVIVLIIMMVWSKNGGKPIKIKS